MSEKTCTSFLMFILIRCRTPGPIFSYKLRYIVGFWLVEMAISTNQEPTIYRNLYENTGPVFAKNTIYWEYNEAVLFDYH